MTAQPAAGRDAAAFPGAGGDVPGHDSAARGSRVGRTSDAVSCVWGQHSSRWVERRTYAYAYACAAAPLNGRWGPRAGRHENGTTVHGLSGGRWVGGAFGTPLLRQQREPSGWHAHGTAAHPALVGEAATGLGNARGLDCHPAFLHGEAATEACRTLHREEACRSIAQGFGRTCYAMLCIAALQPDLTIKHFFG
jgi:hypothetical protein